MKRYAIILLFILFGASLSAREVYNINRDWQFFSNSEISSDNALTVNIPHTWNSDVLGGKKDYFRGIGNYQKEIDIPSVWSDKRIFLKGYGANSICHVFVNGRYVGEHRGGYNAFAFEITDHLQYGRSNTIWIMVNNSPQMDVLPTAGDANVYGGLFRDIELIVTNKEIVAVTDNASDGVYIKQRAVTPQKVEAEAVVMVQGISDNNAVQVQMTLFTDEGDTLRVENSRVRLSGRAISTVNMAFSIDDPRLWNGTLDPYMYNVGIKVISNNTVTDSVVIKTGFRSFAVDPSRGFMLNGEPYRLKGVVVHQDRATMGNAIMSYQVREDIDLICDMGANAVRIADVSHNPEFYELCDKRGIIVWTDFPLVGPAYLTDIGFLDSESFRTNGLRQAAETISQLYNHPSIVMWGIFSNQNTRGDNPVDYIRQLNMLAKNEDPSRFTAAMSNEDGDINFITDLIVWDHHFGWKEGLPSDINIWRDQFVSNWGNLKSGISYSAGASIMHQEDSLYRPTYMGNRHPERWQTHFHEEYFNNLNHDTLFWGVFVGNMFDYGAASRTWGDGTGINDSGLVTFDRKYCKDAYYLYKANWNDGAPFVYIAERRLDKRNKRKQDIKIYSNATLVELYVNGISQGTAYGRNGTFLWEGIMLDEGENVLEARTGNVQDSVQIDVLNSGSLNFIR